MNTIHARSGTSSNADMNDLDGFSLPSDYNYSLQSQLNESATDDFGFDPPTHNTVYPKLETYSPSEMDPLQMTGWSMSNLNAKHPVQSSKLSSVSPNNDMHSYELDRVLPGSSSAIARFGQVTPPRSNSASSEEKVMSPKTSGPERRKRNSKTTVKEDPASSQTNTTGRKRKNSRKSSAVSDEQDDKRKQSLEKNRLAAAKCRINKKEKTEQLQRDSHDKAVHNAFLKEQVMRMKEEVQQMNAVLLAHANCDGCKSPEEIQKHLNDLGNEFFSQHMSAFNYGDFSQLNMHGGMHMGNEMHPDFFSPTSTDDLMNPPLPDFDEGPDFEVHSPMQTD